jgi:hypothetical protein
MYNASPFQYTPRFYLARCSQLLLLLAEILLKLALTPPINQSLLELKFTQLQDITQYVKANC